MKKVWFVVSLIVVTIMMAACGSDAAGDSQDEVEAITIDTSEVMDQIESQISDDMDGETGMFQRVNLTNEEDPMGQMYIDTMGIERNLIASGFGYQSMMNVNSTTIIVLESASTDDVLAVKEGLEAYLENQVNVWSQYLPDQYEKVENNIIKTEGNYLIYITYDNPENIETIFDEAAEAE
ncbi:protein of unknown function [Halolactibacillus halophilus]|uniref:DUF4358 domain-containing protein n=1 Tax=Halolactibacillus halophilus TaxID=306540 RepID=A0A1I5LZH7_9BACI|nr:DUF4358 domain-containing protein [Halolactibacillus halophilus]GEM00962.1 hypothetical protein HHA03_04940 [Halolactibacillus halophilus]SFP02739.1 protein of unknown function [Halolactibacillus halophilus]